ncbi:MAG: hypothetical protein ACRC6I_21835, partial [Paracoccaceae bacterium]
VEDPVVPMIPEVSYLAADGGEDDLSAADAGVAHILADHAAALAEDQPAAVAEEDLAAFEDDLPEAVVEATPLEETYFEADEDLRAALADPVELPVEFELPVETAVVADEVVEDTALHAVEDDSDLGLDDAADLPVETAAFADDIDLADDTAFEDEGELTLEEIAEIRADISEVDLSDEMSDSDDDMLLRLSEDMAAPAAEAAPAVAEAMADHDSMLSDIAGALAEADVLAEPEALQNADTIIFNDDEDLLPEAAMPTDDADDLIEPEAIADDLDDAPLAAELPVPVAAAEPAETAISEKAQRARARIIRVRRNPEIAIAPKAAPAPSAEDAAQAALSAEAEAELQRELAALEDASTDADEFDAALRAQLSAIGAAEEPAAPAAAAQPAALDPTVEDESLRRLMDQTQSEMAEPANRRRLSSISHLKAAVAATIAERFGSKPKPAEEAEAVRTEPYRNDLARAVRPVRPTATGEGERPVERPTPLVLVSEQRIDRPAPVQTPAQAPAHVTPVRPRRVSAQAVAIVQQVFEDDDLELDADADDNADNIFGDTKGFTEFADRIGATDLPQLLEAAAAYSSAVEGRENFTRPQLLRPIEAVTGAEVSREDELRGFGTLLRNGRIVKVKRGQFALTEASSYLDEARKIAG